MNKKTGAQQVKASEDHRYRILFKQWDRGKGDAMGVVEHSTKWMSWSEAQTWLRSHYTGESYLICDRFATSPAPNAHNKQQPAAI
jgi:hypothetical protein